MDISGVKFGLLNKATGELVRVMATPSSRPLYSDVECFSTSLAKARDTERLKEYGKDLVVVKLRVSVVEEVFNVY